MLGLQYVDYIHPLRQRRKEESILAESKLAPIETIFANLIWSHEPISSGELVKLCEKELGWKKSTTYTILKRLCNRGIFHNQHGIVTSLISHQDYLALQSQNFVEETFEGSLPLFLAAFTRRRKLSQKEIAELQKWIEENRG